MGGRGGARWQRRAGQHLAAAARAGINRLPCDVTKAILPTAWRRLVWRWGAQELATQHQLGGAVTVVQVVGLPQCIDDLVHGKVDAVSTDEILLKGYAATHTEDDLVVPDSATFGTVDEYGIGVPLGDSSTCEAWQKRIRQFITSGTAAPVSRSRTCSRYPTEL